MPESTSVRERLQSRLRAERSASNELLRNYRRAIDSRRTPLTTIAGYLTIFLIGGPLLFVACPLILLSGLNQIGGHEFVLAQVGLWTLIAGFAFAEILLKQLHCSSHHACFAHLPFLDHTIAKNTWKNLALLFLLALYPAGLAYGVLGYEYGFDLWQSLVAFGLSAFHYCLIVFVGTWLAVCLPRWKHYVFATGLAIGSLFTMWPEAILPEAYAAILMLLPTSWPGAVLFLSIMEGLPQGLALLLPLVGIVFGINPLRRMLISRFNVSEFMVVSNSTTCAVLDGPLSGAERWSWREPGQLDTTLMLDPVEAASRIRLQGMTQRRLTDCGWVEWIVLRFLTPHQQSVITFLYGESPQWSVLCNYIVVLSAALAVTRIFIPETRLSPIHIVLLVAVSSWFLEQCRGAEPRRCGNSFVARFAEYPVSMKEITHVALKALTVRCVIFGLLLLPISVAWYAVNGIAISGVSSLAGFVVITWKLAYRFSMGFTLPLRRRDAVLAAIIGSSAALATLSGIIVAAAGWRRHDSMFPVGLCLMVAATYGIQQLVKWMIDAGKMDLLHSGPSLYSQSADQLPIQRIKIEARRKWIEAQRLHYGPFWRLKWLFGYDQ